MTASTQQIDTDIQVAVDILKNGGLVAIPTETVYGLACDANNPEALKKLYTVKGRPDNHPVIIHIAGSEQLPDWAINIPEAAYELADVFWPGPLTMILQRRPDVSDQITGGQNTIGIRVPNHPLTLQLLQQFEGGLAAPSANKFGHLSPTSPAHVLSDLGDEVDYILDGGNCPVGVESTIIDLSMDMSILGEDDSEILGIPKSYPILRPGMILAEDIQSALENTTIELLKGPSDVRVSGNLPSHYAPRTSTKLIKPEQLSQAIALTAYKGKRVGVLHYNALDLPQTVLATHTVVAMAAPNHATTYAQLLYANLRQLDNGACDIILVEAPPAEDPAWAAISDRLQRATK